MRGRIFLMGFFGLMILFLSLPQLFLGKIIWMMFIWQMILICCFISVYFNRKDMIYTFSAFFLVACFILAYSMIMENNFREDWWILPVGAIGSIIFYLRGKEEARPRKPKQKAN